MENTKCHMWNWNKNGNTLLKQDTGSKNAVDYGFQNFEREYFQSGSEYPDDYQGSTRVQ